MNLILCLDDRGGLLFNRRRLSRDIAVCKRCLSLADTKKLRMNSYSAKLFAEYMDRILVEEDFYKGAGENDFCFAESELPDLVNVGRLYVFRWNRNYPSDVRFDPLERGFTLKTTEDIAGNSHPVITLEVYEP